MSENGFGLALHLNLIGQHNTKLNYPIRGQMVHWQINQERLDSQFNNVYFDKRTEVMWMFTVFGILDPCEMSSGLEGGGAEHRTGIPPGV